MKWSEDTKLPYKPTHAMRQVACKIRHVYGLKETDFKMTEAVAKPYLEGAKHIIDNSSRFASSRTRSIEDSRLTQEQVTALDQLIPQVFENYGHGFEVREKVRKATVSSLRPSGFDENTTRRAIADAYINHISNDAQHSLSALGLNTKSAISLHGMIIEAALSCRYGTEEINGETTLLIPGNISLAYIEPVQAPENRPEPSAAVSQLESYWRSRGKKIEQSCYPNR